MSASLPMYMRPELLDAHQSFWSHIRRELTERDIESPEALSQPEDLYSHWLTPDLVLSQTCGMPYRNSLHGKVQLIGTPDYAIDDCAPGYYRSAMVVRIEDNNKSLLDYSELTFAYNSKDSQSGYAAPCQLCQSHGFWFEKQIPSGSHKQSTIEVLEGRADIAAIDPVTWQFLKTYERYTHKLAVIDWTPATPGLPYITSNHNDAEKIFESINAAISTMPADTLALLGIRSIVAISAEDYLAVNNPVR